MIPTEVYNICMVLDPDFSLDRESDHSKMVMKHAWLIYHWLTGADVNQKIERHVREGLRYEYRTEDERVKFIARRVKSALFCDCDEDMD